MMRVLVLLALLGAAVAVPNRISRIVGGEPTSIETFPYMSNMQYGWFGILWFQACGGSLLTNNIVLSAAHCYLGDTPSEWRVRLGATNVNQGIEFLVSQLMVHEGYDPISLVNDVAIVRLASFATYSTAIQPARIPSPQFILPDEAPVIAVGWGTLTQGGISPDILHSVEVSVINQEECAKRYAFLKTQPGYQYWPDITPGMLCAGILDVGGKDACQGDSGGPLAYQGDIVVGVTSWGFGCADATYPGVNARVSQYTDWIVGNAQ